MNAQRLIHLIIGPLIRLINETMNRGLNKSILSSFAVLDYSVKFSEPKS